MLSRVTHGRPARREEAPVIDDRLVHETPDERPVEPLGEERQAVATATLEPARPEPDDIRSYELAAWSPLVVLIVLFGLWPGLLLSLTTPAVRTLLGVVS
jgi:NADH-quinone oxidoreductase subunit M